MKINKSRQSKNVEDRRKNTDQPKDQTEWDELYAGSQTGQYKSKDKAKIAKEVQGYIADNSPYLKSNKPIAKQEPSEQLGINNWYKNSPDSGGVIKKTKTITQLQEGAKPTKLTDVVFPKEYKPKSRQTPVSKKKK